MRHPLLFALVWFWAGVLSAQNTTVQPGAAIHLVGSGKLILQGNLTNNGNVQSADQSAVRFVGDTRSTISGSGGTVLQDLQLAKSTESVELLQSITVNGTLEFVNDANYLLCADDTLTLGPNAGDIVGADASNYVVTNGEGALLKKQVAAAFFYPVGFDQSTYNPVALANLGGAEDLGIRCREHMLSHANVGTPAAQDAVDASWDLIKPQSNGANISLDLNWNGTDELPGFNRASCFVGQFGNGSWAVAPSNAVTGSDPYTTTRHGISTAGTLGVFSATPTVANAGSDVAVCSTSSALLSAIAPATGTGTWSVQSGTGGSFGDVNAPNTGFSGVLGQTYTLLWTIDGQLGPWLSSTDAVNVAFEIPSTAEAGDNQSICSNGMATLAASGSNGTGVWSIVGGPATSISQLNNPTAANATFTPTGGAGTYTLRWTVSNLSCPPATDEMVVFVDVPSIVCPSNITRNTDINQCSAIVTYANPTFSNTCGTTIARTGGLASGSAFPNGVNMVEWKATSGAGLMAICQFTVTISDNQQPTITCPANIVRGTDAGQCSAVVTYAAPTATDNCAIASVLRTSAANTASGSQFPKGSTTVTWEAADNATPSPNKKSCSFTVTVNDTQAPSITCPASQTKSTDPNACTAAVTYTEPTPTDNCPGVMRSLQSGLPTGSDFPKGITTVVWKATDAVGLTKTCTFRITVNDMQAPTITCPGSQNPTNDPNQCSAVATYANATFMDNCLGGSVLRISGLTSGSAFPRGVSAVVFRATDGAGLTKTCSFTVTVTDAQLPAINCPQNISATGNGNACTATVAYTTPTATDNCMVQSTFLLSGLSSGSQFPQGVTTNVWRAIDNSGMSQTCAFTVTVSCGTNSFSRPTRKVGDVTAEQDVAYPPLGVGREGLTLNLVPNPALAEVTISAEGLSDDGGELTVFDTQGKAVWQQLAAGEQTRIDLDDRWPNGVYMVVLRSEEQVVTKRLVVHKL